MLKVGTKILAIGAISLCANFFGEKIVLLFFSNPKTDYYSSNYPFGMYVLFTLIFTYLPLIIYLFLERLFLNWALPAKMLIAVAVAISFQLLLKGLPSNFYTNAMLIKNLMIPPLVAFLFPWVFDNVKKELKKPMGS